MSSADRSETRVRVVNRGPPGPMGPSGPPGFPVCGNILLEFSERYPSTRSTITYDSQGRKTKIEVYDLSTLEYLVFTKTFEYDSNGRLAKATTNYWPMNAVLVRTVAYDSSGNILGVDKEYSGPV